MTTERISTLTRLPEENHGSVLIWLIGMAEDDEPIAANYYTEKQIWVDGNNSFDRDKVEFWKEIDPKVKESVWRMRCAAIQNEIDEEILKELDKPYKKYYNKVLKSGMFWEFHPTFTGIWKEDRDAFIKYQIDHDYI